MMNYVVLILGMALITWTIRAAVFVLGDRLVFPWERTGWLRLYSIRKPITQDRRTPETRS